MDSHLTQQPCDRGLAERYLATLDPEAKAFSFQTFTDCKLKRANGRDDLLAKTFHGSLDAHWQKLASLNNRGAGVFVCINQTDLKSRKASNIVKARAVWRDMDDPAVSIQPPLEPHITVQTSPGKTQDLFLVDESVTLNHAKRHQKVLVDQFGSDPAAKDIARVLRLPGFYHLKDPKQPHFVTITHESGTKPYSHEALNQALSKRESLAPGTKNVTSAPHPVISEEKLQSYRDALRAIDSDCDYDTWLKIGQALHSTKDPRAFAVWDEWSKRGTKYKEAKPATKWDSFSADGGLTIGTFFWIVDKHRRVNSGEDMAELPPDDQELNPSLPNPRIQVQKGILAQAVDMISEILVGRNALYRRNGNIVILLHDEELSGNPVLIKSMNLETISYMADKCIDFFTVKKVTEKPADPPRAWMDTLIKTKSWLPALKPLADITRQPILRGDGSILDQPGYDPESKLYYASDEAFPQIPENPTFRDSKKAVKALLEPFRGYDFVSREDESALLAVLLTAATRKSFPTAPGILITSPVAGSGKTKMAQCINILAGATEAVHNWPGKNEKPERQKKLLSELVNCSPGILFDNLEGELQDPTLCEILTSPLYTGRILGQTESVTVPTRVMLLFTGNNVRPAADLCRRILQIQLDPQCESPEKRKFDFDPTDVVRDNRPRLVSAALTVLRAYDVAGRPETFQTAIGSYREFDLLVRGAVVWLGFDDIANCINRTQSDDPDKDMLLDLHDAWEACFEFGKVQNAQLQELIKKGKDQSECIEEDEHRLIDTLCQLTSGRTTPKTLTSRQVTTILGHRKGRIVANRRFAKVKRTGAARGGWQLEQVKKSRPDEEENVPEEESVPPHRLETENRTETPVLGVEF